MTGDDKFRDTLQVLINVTQTQTIKVQLTFLLIFFYSEGVSTDFLYPESL